jgi:dihydroflavonol-4-reductase
VKVLVTGATGFVGSWTAAAVAAAGHELRVLVRTPDKLAGTLGALGVGTTYVVPGDMTDAGGVEHALEGVDAVVHAAALVSMRPSDARRMRDANLRGTELVVGGAVGRGVPRVVAVSSLTAVLEPGRRHVSRATPVGRSAHGYAASKAAVETYLRSLQDDGAPVSTTLAGAVVGPPAGTATSEALAGVVTALRTRVLPCAGARFSAVDVRELAAVHLALSDAAIAPGRYLCAGRQFRVRDLADDLTAVTGRRVVAAPLPGTFLRITGRLLDRTPIETVLTAEGMTAYTSLPEVDDSPVRDELGISWRPRRESLADSLAGMHAAGLLSSSLVGRLAAPEGVA